MINIIRGKVSLGNWKKVDAIPIVVVRRSGAHEVGRWRGTIAGPAPSASSRTTQDRFRVMWLSSRDIP